MADLLEVMCLACNPQYLKLMNGESFLHNLLPLKPYFKGFCCMDDITLAIEMCLWAIIFKPFKSLTNEWVHQKVG